MPNISFSFYKSIFSPLVERKWVWEVRKIC